MRRFSVDSRSLPGLWQSWNPVISGLKCGQLLGAVKGDANGLLLTKYIPEADVTERKNFKS
jgi:hypothetical protein